MMPGTQPFDLACFSELVGTAPATIPASAQKLLQDYALSYRALTAAESAAAHAQVLERMATGHMAVSGAHRHGDWERGWSENLEAFRAGGHDPEVLVPKYLQPDQIDRLNGAYIRSETPYFQVRVYDIFRHYLFQTYLSSATAVYEFGCGTGYNLHILAGLLPEMPLWGLDWAEASVQLIQEMAQNGHPQLQAQRFDMFHPEGLELQAGAAVLTLNAMEQLGGNFQPFVDYLLAQHPAIGVHAEPLLELYDPADPFDDIARRYHEQRGYLTGFVPHMQALAAAGQIEILKLQRVRLGNQFHEGYSLLIWKPRKKEHS
ncbi:MAG: hypothetical protein ACO1RX_04885 [Candidatus Sericytochromatia bacterium]